MNLRRLTALIGGAAIVAALLLVAALSLGRGVSPAFAAQPISAKQSTLANPSCEPSSPLEWHFVITQVDKAANAPASITVSWDNGATEVVPLTKFTGGVAHYTTTSNLAANVTSATTTIYDKWKGQFNLSHGPCVFPLNVTKTANPTYERTYAWDIVKDVDDATLYIPLGQDSITANYTVTVSVDGSTDSDFAVAGTISITNPNTWIGATITSVADVVSPDIAATVNCPVSFPYELAASGSLQCTYATDLEDATDRTNTATVTTSGKVPGGSGTAPVDFGDPTTVTDECVDVTDTYGNANLGTVCVGDAPETFQYARTFTRADLGNVCGSDVPFANTATATAQDSGAAVPDDANVVVQAECAPLDVSKTAVTTYDRTYTWDIAKVVVGANAAELPVGTNSVTFNYNVTVTADGGTDGNYGVNGAITIANPNPVTAATITSVTDLVSPDVAATVNCPVAFPYALAGGGVLSCTYASPLGDGSARTNTATATTSGPVPGDSGSADVIFGAPTNLVDECVDVNDDLGGYLGNFCVGDSPVSIPYSLTFTRDQVPACDTPANFVNTATSTTNDTGTVDSASATVTVTKRCAVVWCSPGFWSQNYPNLVGTPYDITPYLGVAYSTIGGAPLKDGAPANPTIQDILDAGPSVYGGEAFNSVATYLSAQFGWFGPAGDPHFCPINADGSPK